MKRSAQNAVAAGLALVMLGASCWTVLPGPTPFTLALAVVMPEIAPISFPAGVLLTVAIAGLAVGGARTFALAIAGIANLCFVWPLVAFPFALHTADLALSAGGAPAVIPHAALLVDVTRDVPVHLHGGGALALDFYRPRTAGACPLLVTVYGGAWQFGSRAFEASLARQYAAQGYAVAAIDYRHAPRFHFPAQIEDVDDALRTIAFHARGWRIDSQRVALFGRSAGAQLALLAAERPQPVRVRAVVAYYAPTDLIGGWETPPRPDPVGVRAILSRYLGGPPDEQHRSTYAAAAPLTNAHAGMPPTLLVVGDRDELVLPRFQREFAARLRALGVRAVALELPWANHAFDQVDGLGAHVAGEATARFLNAALR